MRYITKRNNKKEKFDPNKIIKSIHLSAYGLNLDTSKLERSINLIEDDYTTSDIQDFLINKSLSQINLDLDNGLTDESFSSLNNDYFSARLVFHSVYSEVYHNRGDNVLFSEVIKDGINKGIYSPSIMLHYTPKELNEASNFMNKKYDDGFKYSGANMLKSRYLAKDENGKLHETPQEMYLIIALLLASNEKNKLYWAEKFYHVIASRKISPATPILMNLRKTGGNLSSCFINDLPDDLPTMFDKFLELANISKNGGGCGINVSSVRSKGAEIRGVSNAGGGVTPFIKIINDIGVAINQLGARKGAITPAIDIWHRDVYDFLDMQKENGDTRTKSYDVFPQIVIPDLFMKRVEDNSEWTLVDPHEVRKKYNVDLKTVYGDEFNDLYKTIEKDKNMKLNKTIKAKDLFVHFLHTVVETGLPYVSFKDTINNSNPNKHCGFIGNSNLCTESFSNFNKDETHVCNLISLNLAEIKDSELEEVCALATRMLDNTIDLTDEPIDSAKRHNNKYRIIGIGAMGLHDRLSDLQIPYAKSEKYVDELFEKIAFYSLRESNNIAVEKGSYSEFNGSDFSKGILFGREKSWYQNQNNVSLKSQDWIDLINSIMHNGIRNGSLFAIAPNTSTSVLVGCTASILPIFKRFFIESNSKGIVPMWPNSLNKDNFWYYNENINTDQQKVINVVSRIQKWVDQGISMELFVNVNLGIKAKHIWDFYFESWRKKVKTVYYLRSITKSKKEDCISCAN